MQASDRRKEQVIIEKSQWFNQALHSLEFIETSGAEPVNDRSLSKQTLNSEPDGRIR